MTEQEKEKLLAELLSKPPLFVTDGAEPQDNTQVNGAADTEPEGTQEEQPQEQTEQAEGQTKPEGQTVDSDIVNDLHAKDRLALIQEVEQLKLEIAKYKPVYDKHVDDLKTQALKQYRINDEDIDHWKQRLTGETADEINKQAEQLAEQLGLKWQGGYVDPSIINPSVSRPRQKSLYEQGRETAKQALSNKYGMGAQRSDISAPPVRVKEVSGSRTERVRSNNKSWISKWLRDLRRTK